MNYFQKRLLLFVSLFGIVFGGVFYFLLHYKNTGIDEVLHEQLRYLEISYKQALDRFEVISKNAYITLLNDEVFLDILAQAAEASTEKKEELRARLFKHLEAEFEKLQSLEVMYLQVVLPNNESFLRAHKPSKYGDDLSSVRYSIKYSNSEKIPVFGFEQGKTSHAFRHIFPLYKDAKHIGAVDVAFSSTMLQNYTMRASNIHTHFIVNKNVFASQAWKRNTQEPYFQSIEHADYMFSMSDHVQHKRLDESKNTIILPLRAIINEKIATGKEFALYREVGSKVKVVAFLPIQNVKKDKTVAYLVSYTRSTRIEAILKEFKVSVFTAFAVLVLIFVLLCKSMRSSDALKKELQYDSLTKVYNRKYFLKQAEEEFAKSKRFGHELCIVMADIDYFKNINDTYGHQCGDSVLKETAQLMRASIRSFDMIGRYGGEEFILLIMTNKENSAHVVENMRNKLENHLFCQEHQLKLTSSFGIAQLENEASLDEIIKRADDALYKSKNEGRNRISIA
ncbi:diguanylate cyclase [bacterium]|nr:diguanylate cyclase [bacterium]MBU1989560.1 diguanylate cyclase [bacterium]